MCICTQVYLHGYRWEGNTSVCVGGGGVSVWQLYTDGVCQGACISALWATHSPSFFLRGFCTCKMETATVPISHEIDFPSIRSVLRDQSHKAQEEPCLGLTKMKTLTSYSLLRRRRRQRQGEASGLGPPLWVLWPPSPFSQICPRHHNGVYPIRTTTAPQPSTSVLQHVG